MKKVIMTFFAFSLTVALLAGCGNKDTKENETSSQAQATGADETAKDNEETQTSDATEAQTEPAEGLTQTEKALALIDTFVTGDTEAAKNLLAEGYIQHNLAYGTGCLCWLC